MLHFMPSYEETPEERRDWSLLYSGKLNREDIDKAVRSSKWQELRIWLKGKSAGVKYTNLKLWLEFNQYSTESKIQVTNYVTALSRGGIINRRITDMESQRKKYPPCELDCFNCKRPVEKCNGGAKKYQYRSGYLCPIESDDPRDVEIRKRRASLSIGKVHNATVIGSHKVTKKGSYLHENYCEKSGFD